MKTNSNDSGNKYRFSLFLPPITNTEPSCIINISELNEKCIKNIQFLEITKEIKNCDDKDERDNLKRQELMYATPSGVVNYRNDRSLTEHSGYIVIDIDALSEERITNLKSNLIADKIINPVLIFRSPSGRGIKCFIKIPPCIESHPKYFNALENYMQKIYDIKVDASCKNVSRGCFIGYDADAYYVENEHCLDENFLKEWLPIEPEKSFSHINEDNKTNEQKIKEVETLVGKIELTRMDITSDYKDWIKVGFALCELSEEGRCFFHRLSKLSLKYNERECDEKYSDLMRDYDGKISIGSLFHLAKEKGFRNKNVCQNNNNQGNAFVPVTSDSVQKPPSGYTQNENGILLPIQRIQKFLNENYCIRLNVVTNRIELRNQEEGGFYPMEEYHFNTVLGELRTANIPISASMLREILYSNFSQRFDPFLSYLNSLPEWNQQTDFLSQLSSTVVVTEQKMWESCLKKWMVAMVASLINPKQVNHTALIFSGPQGVGKTTWIRNLIPDTLQDYIYSGVINPTDKDTVIHLSECILINMDELENMNRTEVGSLKEIITKTNIRIRRPYAHVNESLVRRASFAGSVNNTQFLNDTTGSRRFLCFEVSDIEFEHAVDLNGVYAQALYLFRSGFQHWFDKEETGKINENNEQYRIISMEEESLLQCFEVVSEEEYKSNPGGGNISLLTTTEIAGRLGNKIGFKVMNGTIQILGKVLKKHNFHKVKTKGIQKYVVRDLYPFSVDENNNILTL